MYQTGLSFNLTIMLEFQKNNNNYKNLNKKEWVSLCLSCVAIVYHLKLHLKLEIAIWQLILHIYYPKKKKIIYLQLCYCIWVGLYGQSKC